MAGQPQDNSWTQQGQGYAQGTPGYDPAYGDQQGTPAPYPQGQAYEQQPGGYEQPQPYQQGQAYEQGQQGQAYEQQAYQRPAAYDHPTILDQPAYNQSGQQARAQYDLPGQQGPGQQGQGQQAYQQGQGQQAYGQPQAHPGQQQGQQALPGQAQGRPHPGWEQWQLPRQQAGKQPGKQARGERGFLGSLFDFGFNSFVTPKIIKVLYVLVTIWTVLWALVFLRLGFHYGHVSGGLATLIIVDPILILVSLGVFRVILEFFMVTFRMQEDLKSLREHATEAASKADGEGESVGDGTPSSSGV